MMKKKQNPTDSLMESRTLCPPAEEAVVDERMRNQVVGKQNFNGSTKNLVSHEQNRFRKHHATAFQ